MSKDEKKLKVYYNSACPVCDAGIRSQRRRMEATGAEAEWIDIHNHPEALREIGAEQEFVRRKLHVTDAAGELHVGSEAFTALWSRTAGQRWLGRLCAMPVLRTLSRWAYDAFAALLYRWNRMRRRW